MRWLGGHIHPLRDEIVNRGSFTRVVIDPSIGMLPVSCEQLLSLAGLFFRNLSKTIYFQQLSKINKMKKKVSSEDSPVWYETFFFKTH